MYYSIYCEDSENSLEKRQSARPEHVVRLQDLQSQGRLLLAGPNPMIDSEDPGPAGFSGSIIIAEFDSLEDAEIWAKDDPFVHAGVYEKVTVKPFKKTMPA
mgnify:CR=1 FL=1|jgi:uncharacterized protein